MTVRSRLHLVAAAAGVLTALVGMAVWWDGEREGGDWQWTLPVALVYGTAAVALTRRALRLAVVFALMGLSAGLSLLSGELAGAAADGQVVRAGELAVWLSSWTWLPSYVLLLAVVPHLLPDGRLPGGRPRWGYRVGVTAAVVSTVAWMVCPYDELDEASDAAIALGATNPVGIPGASALVAVGLVLTLLGTLAGLVTLGLRWRRERDRTAMPWVVSGVVATVVLMLASLATPAGSSALMALAVLPLPLSVVLGSAANASRLDRELRSTQARLAVAQEEERRRLRHDLHDSLGPTLAGVALQLEGLSAVMEAQPALAAEVADRLTARVQEAVAEVRRLVEGLGPEGSLGLAEALRTQVEDFDAPTLRSSLQLEPADVADLPAAVEVVAVRVVREAMANAARHAGADSCTVQVDRQPDALQVVVRDNGIGIDAARAVGRSGGTGVGLLSMRAVAEQIGGSCEVGGAPGGGTEVRLVLPVPAGSR